MKQALTVPRLKTMKNQGKPIAMVTAYDYPSAMLSEEAGVDLILVGDSLGNVVLGYETTVPVTLEDMIYHTRSVVRGAPGTMIVTDMPFATYRLGPEATLRNAARIMQEGGAQAVKLEGGAELAAEVRLLTSAGIPVLGHLGLTPQSVHQIGGYKVQGKSSEEAEKLLQDAKALEHAGAFGIVLELVPEELAAAVTHSVGIPTIGIGAGRGCDGQVLVYHDLIRYGSGIRDKKMVKSYANVGDTIRDAIAQYVDEVKTKAFPEEKHAFTLQQSADPAQSGTGKLYGGERK
ncbi:3-methyl-2-oxobutanoate hydroxymethyltransferase [Cohnella sp. CIP 111063]|uniref:3-methyl-2-oxobutanoate hydroxymethyltransferase n=1 Tax=unclassified Cohnella TaxID=2636738 RepID=UPI000B8BC36A|nr:MULTISPECIES: 3-methyl-2-oxobutanoate hydroxymethyltransferase [unclassified Cohnella]OXS61161.1 3-methyl-2-oxobutanoate hydroxymethyltransferase [Cohnella sp. CIP 111063]PRX73718.1 ketopantoate hydroxymethyltransferase [Cohnella sp. SGD-V74]